MMFTVVVKEKGGDEQELAFNQAEVTIGRSQGNDIVLPKSNISKRHALLQKGPSGFSIIDSKSTNGTFINGKRIDGPYELQLGDKIFVGDFSLTLHIEKAVEEPIPVPPVTGEHPSPTEDEPLSASEEEHLSDEAWQGDKALSEDWDEQWDAPQKPVADPGIPSEPHFEAQTAMDSEPVSALPVEAPNARPAGHPPTYRSLYRLLHEDPRPTRDIVRDPDLLNRLVERAAREVGYEGFDPNEIADELTGRFLFELFELSPDVERVAMKANGTVSLKYAHGWQRSENLDVEPEAVPIIQELTLAQSDAPTGKAGGSTFRGLIRFESSGIFVHAVRASEGAPLLILERIRFSQYAIDELVGQSVLSEEMASFLHQCLTHQVGVTVAASEPSVRRELLAALMNATPAHLERVVFERGFPMALDPRRVHCFRLSHIAPAIATQSAQLLEPARWTLDLGTPDDTILHILEAVSHANAAVTVGLACTGNADPTEQFIHWIDSVAGPKRDAHRFLLNVAPILLHAERRHDGGILVTSISGLEPIQDGIRVEEVFKSTGEPSAPAFEATGFTPSALRDVNRR